MVSDPRVDALRRRRAGGRDSSAPFVVAAKTAPQPRMDGFDLLRAARCAAARLGGLAAQASAARAAGEFTGLPMSVAMRLAADLEEVISLASLAHARLDALLAKAETASAQSALDEGRGA